jgi:hypothetical protein
MSRSTTDIALALLEMIEASLHQRAHGEAILPLRDGQDDLRGIGNSGGDDQHIIIHMQSGRQFRVYVEEVEPDDEDEAEERVKCAVGLHSWIDHVGKLSPDTRCTICGEPYGDPD